MSAGQRVRSAERRREPRLPRASNSAPEIFLWSRAPSGPPRSSRSPGSSPTGSRSRPAGDPPFPHDPGSVIDVWARWDSAGSCESPSRGTTPLGESARSSRSTATVGALGRVLLGHYVLAGIRVSLAGASARSCSYTGSRRNGSAPTARGAPSSTSPSSRCPSSCRRSTASRSTCCSRWPPSCSPSAGASSSRAAAGLAMLTRATGVALLPSLVLLAWRERRPARALPRSSSRRSLRRLSARALAGDGDPWAFLRAQELWHRHLSPAGPARRDLGRARAGWAGIEQLASGSHTHIYWTRGAGHRPIRARR